MSSSPATVTPRLRRSQCWQEVSQCIFIPVRLLTSDSCWREKSPWNLTACEDSLPGQWTPAVSFQDKPELLLEQSQCNQLIRSTLELSISLGFNLIFKFVANLLCYLLQSAVSFFLVFPLVIKGKIWAYRAQPPPGSMSFTWWCRYWGTTIGQQG